MIATYIPNFPLNYRELYQNTNAKKASTGRASISLLLIRLSCYRYAPKDKRFRWPLAHMPRWYPLPPVQRNSSDLGDSHKWPWSGLGGSDPWTTRPARRPWLSL